jgi:hypothetical protein
MKIFILLLVGLISLVGKGQENKIVFGVSTNIVKHPLSTYGLDAIIMKKNSKLQGMINFDFIRGKHNYQKLRYTYPFNSEIMTHENDQSSGWGMGGQLNYSLLKKDETRDYDFLFGFGYQYQSLKMRFKEEMYISEPPYYFHRPQYFREPIKSNSTQMMLMFQIQKPFFLEIGLGVAYQNAQISETLKLYRDYNKYEIDFGYSGLKPVMSFKLGYLFNR